MTDNSERVHRGALRYGEEGSYHVWEHSNTGRKRWDFNDEYMAMQCAVKLGSVVESNDGDGRTCPNTKI